jgi:phytoene dehydrogenase-like protein
VRVAVIGAGFAGLAAAVALQERRHQVTLFERRGVPGGRATSYRDAPSGDQVGSGSHVLFGADTETLDLLRRAGGAAELEDGRLAWRGRGGYAPLVLGGLPGRWAFAAALLRPGLPARVRLEALRLALLGPAPGANATAQAFLAGSGQGALTRARLWAPLCELLLHETLEQADAGRFRRALGRTLMAGRRAGRLRRPRAGFAVLHDRLVACFESRGGRLVRRARVTELLLRDGRVTGLAWIKRPEARQAIRRAEDPREGRLAVDAVVSGIPWRALVELLPEPLRREPPWSELGALPGTPAAIAEVWLEAPFEGEPVLATGDPDFAWALAQGPAGDRRRLSLTLSEALQTRISRGGRELNAAAAEGLGRIFGGALRPVRSLLIREVEGTLPQHPDTPRLASGHSPLRGLLLAGDWTANEPASIEAAVRSGREAARRLEAGG